MTITLPKMCSMSSSQTGLVGTIGVTLLNPDGTTHTARTTVGIYEIGGGSYGKQIGFDDNWIGSIKWDTGGGSPVYAIEEYNYYENNPKVDTILIDTTAIKVKTDTIDWSNITSLVDEIGGKWEITGNQMIFYKSDNITEIFRFNLFNAAGNPAMADVYKRERVP